jgi:CubicO group peptidase (beta-lactamase class C family)
MKYPKLASLFALSRTLPFASALLGGSVLAQPPAPAPTTLPSDEEVRKILADRVGDPKRGIALVAGLIDEKGRRVVTYGSLARDDARTLDGDTVFEIGSITKVFTSLVLMDMVQKGELAVTDPVAKFLPAEARVPERNGRKITLQDLATQNSGLPRMPSNFSPKDPRNPYADYTPERLYAFLSGYELTRDIGSQFEYSNLGVGLLGHALSLHEGKDYETMLRARVLGPLDMKSTSVSFTPEMKSHLAIGHGPAGEPAANWDLAVLTGAGGIRSTANDMLKFLAANLGYEKTSLAEAMTAQLGIRRPAGGNMEIAYNWFIQTKNGRSIVWHNGGTGGYRSFAGFNPQARTGVIVLTNISTPAGVDDIGRHLLDASLPLAKTSAPTERAATGGEAAKPAPGAEKALRRNIEELRAGEPKYDLMSPGLADVTRQQLPRLQKMMQEFGAIESVTFKGAAGNRTDIFEVKFEHGTTEWRITMETAEKIAGLRFRPL